MHDYSADVETEPSKDGLAQLAEMAAELKAAILARENAERELERAKAVERYISMEQIPALMDELGIETFTAAGGLKIAVEELISASIPAGDPDGALAWLDANGHGGLIRHEISVMFTRDQAAAATALQAELAARFRAVKGKAGVHPQTLGAWARERLAEGAEIPPAIKVHRVRRAKVQ